MTSTHIDPSHFTIEPRGAFSLRESTEFGFGQRHSTRFDGTMRVAFCVDRTSSGRPEPGSSGAGTSSPERADPGRSDSGGAWAQAGVALTQDDLGVHGTVVGDAPVQRVRDQVARMLSLDVDAGGYEAVAARDPVVARVMATAPGLRPPLFHSPYEAAAWCVLSLRWNARQAAAVRDRLSRAHGRGFDVAGVPLAAFPTPTQLLDVAVFPGIPPVKMERLHGVARAAAEGELDAERLRSAEPDEAMAGLRRIPGIGPFSASLIVLRASGVCDIPVDQEPRLAEIVGRLYGLPGLASAADMDRIGEAWRPFRTWVAVLLRAASARVSEPALTPAGR